MDGALESSGGLMANNGCESTEMKPFVHLKLSKTKCVYLYSLN